MLNRHILSVASKLEVYDVILKSINQLRRSYRTSKKYMNGEHDKFWSENFTKNQIDFNKQMSQLLDIIIEEINRRNNVKYVRKKKLNEIKENLQN